MAAPVADSAVRELALDPRRSIVLEAPAGSGKTTLLTQRLLRLLATVGEPEEILAITFTRKAAAEMRERVWRALRGDVDRASPHGKRLLELALAVNDRSRERGWSLESNPARLRIQTIDSLNRSLVGDFPLAAGGAGERSITQAPEALYALAARRALLDAESDPRLASDAEGLLERLDNDFGRCERLLARMLAVRSQWLPALIETRRAESPIARGASESSLRSRVAASLEAIVGERLRQAHDLMGRALLDEGAALAHEAARRRAQAGDTRPGSWRAWADGPLPASGLALEHWKGLVELALTQAGSWRSTLTVREGFPAEERALKSRARDWIASLARIAGARELLGELAMLPRPALEEEEARSLESLSRLLTLAASELELVFEEREKVDYPYVAAAARRALAEEGGPTDYGLALAARLRHILVDEFQDTSIEQLELIEALTAGWEPGDGRTLFVVGDPMQSIYQFRKAEVGLFLRAATHGIGDLKLEPARLTSNFRSAPGLVAWFNEAFALCFPAADDPRASAVRYRACVAGRPEEPGIVEVHAGPSEPHAEARAVAALVKRLRDEAPRATTAILLASHAHAPPVVEALASLDVPVSGVDLTPLAELPIVRDLEALARALDHLADRTAWLAVLRAPWCGLTVSELDRITEGAAHSTVWEAIEDGGPIGRLSLQARERLERTREVLREALEQKDRLGVAAWVEATWLRLGGPAACAADADLEQAEEFFAALDEWASEPTWPGPLALTRRIEELHARHRGAGAGAVEIMTIHRAKGLEFDHVIVPALGRRLRSSPEPLLRWLELPAERRGADLLMAPIAQATGEASALREYLRGLEAERAAHERARLLYVAATRARRQLHWFAGRPEISRQGSQAGPPSGTLLAALWPAVRASFARAPEGLSREREPALGASVEPPAQRSRLAADWRAPRIHRLPLPPPIAAPGYTDTEEEAPALAPELAAAQVVADQLKRSARQGRMPAAAGISLAMRERLARLGLTGDELERCAEEAGFLLEACLADERLRWILSARHERAQSPLALTGLDAGRLATVVIDRSFVENGVRWLVELRADEPSGGLEERLARAVRLASRLSTEPVRAGCYVARTRRFFERS